MFSSNVKQSLTIGCKKYSLTNTIASSSVGDHNTSDWGRLSEIHAKPWNGIIFRLTAVSFVFIFKSVVETPINGQFRRI